MRTLTEHAQRKFHACSLFLIDLIIVSLSWRSGGGGAISPPTQRLNQLFTYEDSETSPCARHQRTLNRGLCLLLIVHTVS